MNPLAAFFLVDAFGRVLLSRAFLVMAIWVLAPLAAAWIAMARLPSPFTPFCSTATFVAMLAYALHRPTSSEKKLALLDGLFIWCRLLIIIVVVREVARLILGKAPLPVMLKSEMWWMVFGLVAFGFSQALQWWVKRDWERAEQELWTSS